MYIVKLNSSGQLQWNRTIGGPGQNRAYSVVQTNDGGYVVAGWGQSFGACFVKLTSEGTVQWTRALPIGYPAWSIVQTTDGGYAAAISAFEGGGAGSMIIVKLDSIGMPQWGKSIGRGSFARCIRQTLDKGYIVAGATVEFGAQDFDMFVVKFDSNGALQWAKTIGGTNYDFAYSIIQTTDGGYAVAGETNSFGNGSKMYITKLDSNGMLQWMKYLGAGADRANSIIQTSDGSYTVAGWSGFYVNMLIVKLNPDGSLQWGRFKGGATGENYARSIIQTPDGGYVAAGYSGSFGAGGVMFIVKLDINGNTCGNSTSPSISIGTGGVLGNAVPTITSPSLSVINPSPIIGSLGTVTPICVIGIQPISNLIPDTYKLYQNYPNPFNPVTRIKFQAPLSQKQVVSLIIYDALGREVEILINEELTAGTYEVEWDGTNFASGIYYYTLTVGPFLQTKKMVLLK